MMYQKTTINILRSFLGVLERHKDIKMKRINFGLMALLLVSIALNVKYEISTRAITNRIMLLTGTNIDDIAGIHDIAGIPIMQECTEQSWMNCIMKLGIQSDVVFYGDSHTRWSDFRQYFPNVSICNLGLSGDNMNGFIRRVEMIQKVLPKKIFFMGGVNDISGLSLEEYRHKYDTLFRTLSDSLPEAKLYVQSLLPLNPCVYKKYSDNNKVKKVNEIQKELAAKYGLTYIDLYYIYAKDDILPMESSSDGIHLKDYKKWAEAIRPYVYE